ncbi:MAG TPA: alpha-amylase family glycosyl hydrolase, partial [Gaiellales bacterium]|nr:alpha-amylase family glycosyl hydrolase [Gaiellales bacterium]
MDLDSDHTAPTGKWGLRPMELEELKRAMGRWQSGLAGRGWNSLYLSNHDQPRPVSRFGDEGEHRVVSAKLLATFLHLLQGTPYIYQGEEIGMTNVRFASIDDYRDIETLNMYREFVEERAMDRNAVMAMIHAKSRDNARTPMQWDGSANAGFTTGTPWIGVNPNYATINAERALSDPDSILHHYRALIRLRKENPVVVHGRYEPLLDDHPQIYAFTRTLADDRLLVILNFSRGQPEFELPAGFPADGAELLLGNYPLGGGADVGRFTLRPFEARVYRIS